MYLETGAISALDGLYRNLGIAKSRELGQKYNALYEVYGIAKSGSKQITGVVCEGIAKDFVSESLPAGLRIKSGLVFDPVAQEISPQIDGIIYRGVPLLDYTDVAVIEKRNVLGIMEVKSWIGKNDIFGNKDDVFPEGRNPNTGLIQGYLDRKKFVEEVIPYVLFAFEVYSDSPKSEVVDRLKKICDTYVVVRRKVPRKKEYKYNFDLSVSRFINWLRNLA